MSVVPHVGGHAGLAGCGAMARRIAQAIGGWPLVMADSRWLAANTRAGQGCSPPLTRRTSPVTKVISGKAENATARATSMGQPCRSATRSRSAWRGRRDGWHPSAGQGGAGRDHAHRDVVGPQEGARSMRALVYRGCGGGIDRVALVAVKPAMLLMSTMQPHLRSIISGTTLRQQ